MELELLFKLNLQSIHRRWNLLYISGIKLRSPYSLTILIKEIMLFRKKSQLFYKNIIFHTLETLHDMQYFNEHNFITEIELHFQVMLLRICSQYGTNLNCRWNFIGPEGHFLKFNFVTINLPPAMNCSATDNIQIQEANATGKFEL